MQALCHHDILVFTDVGDDCDDPAALQELMDAPGSNRIVVVFTTGDTVARLRLWDYLCRDRFGDETAAHRWVRTSKNAYAANGHSVELYVGECTDRHANTTAPPGFAPQFEAVPFRTYPQDRWPAKVLVLAPLVGVELEPESEPELELGPSPDMGGPATHAIVVGDGQARSVNSGAGLQGDDAVQSARNFRYLEKRNEVTYLPTKLLRSVTFSPAMARRYTPAIAENVALIASRFLFGPRPQQLAPHLHERIAESNAQALHGLARQVLGAGYAPEPDATSVADARSRHKRTAPFYPS